MGGHVKPEMDKNKCMKYFFFKMRTIKSYVLPVNKKKRIKEVGISELASNSSKIYGPNVGDKRDRVVEDTRSLENEETAQKLKKSLYIYSTILEQKYKKIEEIFFAKFQEYNIALYSMPKCRKFVYRKTNENGNISRMSKL